MGRKLSKKRITDAIMDLNPTEVAQIVNAYNRTKKAKVKVNPILIDEMHEKFLKELSPITCIKGGGRVIKDGKTVDTNLQKYKCKECGKKFNILSDTILDKSPIPWNIWVLVPTRYTKKLIMWTVSARNKSNNKWVKLDENDAVAKFNKKYFVNEIPEYKRRQLAKILGIKPFSPIAVPSDELKKKLLAHPNLEDGIYELLGNKNVDV